MSADPVRARSPWLAVAGVCGVYFAFGLTIGVMAPLVGEISRDLSLSRSTMGSILGAWALIYVFTAVPAGAFVDRVGLRWSLTIGGGAIIASALLRSLASGAPTLFAAVAVFGIGGPLVSIATPKLIASLFEADARRLPTGLAVAAPSLGTAVGLALTNPVFLPLLFFAIGEIGGFSGPYLVGFVADRNDGFDTATLVLAAISFAAAASAASLRRVRHAVAVSARTPARRLRTP